MSKPLKLHLKKLDISVTFEKLSDQVWHDNYYGNYAPIFEDYDFIMLLELHHYKKHDFDLAKMYTALFTYFGGHNNYDDYKCSFSYRFKLTIERDGKKYDYGMQLFDMKGNMPYYTYYRKPDEGKSADYYHSPIDAEFSKEDMRHCTMTFINFMVGFCEGYTPYFNQPFYRINQAGYVIYGFDDGKYFVNTYPYSSEEDYANFQKEIAAFKKKKHIQTDMSKDFWKEKINRLKIRA